MSLTEYLKLPGLSASVIKAGRKSMRHMRLAATVPTVATPAMEWGSLVHKAALEPASLLDEVAVWRGGRKAGKAWDEFQEQAGGRLVCTAADVDKLGGITAAIRRNGKARELLAGCEFETVVRWFTEQYGPARARLDAYKPGCIVDLKTTKRIDTATKQAWALGYHLQMAWYTIGVLATQRDAPPPECWLIFVEADAPFDVRPVRCGFDVLEVGHEEAIRIATEYQQCTDRNDWPGVGKPDEVWNLEPWQQPGAGEVDVSDGTMEASEL
jgi:hypothetical protein